MAPLEGDLGGWAGWGQSPCRARMFVAGQALWASGRGFWWERKNMNRPLKL